MTVDCHLANQVLTIIELKIPKIVYSSFDATHLIHFPHCVQLSTLYFIIKSYYSIFESRANRAVSCSNVITGYLSPQLPLYSSENFSSFALV